MSKLTQRQKFEETFLTAEKINDEFSRSKYQHFVYAHDYVTLAQKFTKLYTIFNRIIEDVEDDSGSVQQILTMSRDAAIGKVEDIVSTDWDDMMFAIDAMPDHDFSDEEDDN